MSNPLLVPREYRDFFGIESGVPATDTDWFMVPAMEIAQRVREGTWTREHAVKELTELAHGNEQLASAYLGLAMEGEPQSERRGTVREFTRLVREESRPDVLEDAMSAAISVLREAKQVRRFWEVEEEVRRTKLRAHEERELVAMIQGMRQADR